MSSKSQHVVPHTGGGWSVRSTGSERATRVFEDLQAAVSFARDIAKRGGAELFVHGRDGMVHDHASFGPGQPAPKR